MRRGGDSAIYGHCRHHRRERKTSDRDKRNLSAPTLSPLPGPIHIRVSEQATLQHRMSRAAFARYTDGVDLCTLRDDDKHHHHNNNNDKHHLFKLKLKHKSVIAGKSLQFCEPSQPYSRPMSPPSLTDGCSERTNGNSTSSFTGQQSFLSLSPALTI